MITRTGRYNKKKKVIEINCTDCGKHFEIPATYSQFKRIMNGAECIQYILPNATAEERELFLSGWCDDCFPSCPDEDEEYE